MSRRICVFTQQKKAMIFFSTNSENGGIIVIKKKRTRRKRFPPLPYLKRRNRQRRKRGMGSARTPTHMRKQSIKPGKRITRTLIPQHYYKDNFLST